MIVQYVNNLSRSHLRNLETRDTRQSKKYEDAILEMDQEIERLNDVIKVIQEKSRQ